MAKGIILSGTNYGHKTKNSKMENHSSLLQREKNQQFKCTSLNQARKKRELSRLAAYDIFLFTESYKPPLEISKDKTSRMENTGCLDFVLLLLFKYSV